MVTEPIGIYLICNYSFVSAVTLLGDPVEVYYYGLVYVYFAFSFVPMTLAVSYLYLPVFFSLQLTSAYEVSKQTMDFMNKNILKLKPGILF
jgi:sodium-coupled monocarboxylate transporter 8/12